MGQLLKFNTENEDLDEYIILKVLESSIGASIGVFMNSIDFT